MAESDTQQPESADALPFDRLLQASAQRAALDSLATFADVLGIGTPARHHQVVCDAVTSMIVNDDCDIVLALMPPGSAKSTYLSVALPAWLMARDPRGKVLQASNTSELAERWGRRVRGVLQSPTYRALFPATELDPTSQAAARWGTTEGGEYLALGSGAAALGVRASAVVLDDVHKSLEDATSEVTSAKIREWFDADIVSRLTPKGKIVVVMQRLAYGDLAGHIMRTYGAPGSPRRLKVIKMRMVFEEGDDDGTGRKPGDRLWPEHFTDQMVEDMRLRPVTFRTMGQQEPVTGTSEFCTADMIQVVESAPPLSRLRVVMASDYAVGDQAERGDYSAHVVVGFDSHGTMYVLDCWRGRVPLIPAIHTGLQFIDSYKPLVVLADDDMIARSSKQILQDQMRERGCERPLRFLPTRGRDKRARAAGLEGLLHLRRVKIVKNSLTDILVRELTGFPVEDHDDLLDGLSLACRHINDIGRGSDRVIEHVERNIYAPPDVPPNATFFADGRMYLNTSMGDPNDGPRPRNPNYCT